MISFAGENPSRLVKLRNDWWSGCLVFLSGEKKSIGLAVAEAECNTVIDLKLEHDAA